MTVDATFTAFLVPIGIAFHFRAQYFSWYNALDIAAGAPSLRLLQGAVLACCRLRLSCVWTPSHTSAALLSANLNAPLAAELVMQKSFQL